MRGIVETSFRAPFCRSSALGEAAESSCFGIWICRLAHAQHILWQLASAPPILVILHEPGAWRPCSITENLLQRTLFSHMSVERWRGLSARST